MKVEKKLIAIGVVSILTSITLFLLSDVNVEKTGLGESALDLLMSTVFIFVLFSINFFVLAFLVRKIRKMFAKNSQVKI